MASRQLSRTVAMAALLVLVAACSEGRAVTAGNGPSTEVPATAGPDATSEPEAWTADALGAGSWTGARTDADGRGIVVTFVGGPPFEEGNHCSVAYRAAIEEDEGSVEVQILSRSPAGDGSTDCTAEGHFRSLHIPLDGPLGARSLVEAQFDRRQPVFDGAILREPTWLPEGWTSRYEGPGYPDPGSMTTWQRTWDDDELPPTGDRCTPGDAGVVLTQGPPDLVDRYPDHGERPVSTHRVAGTEAAYAEDEAGTSVRLSWVSDGVGSVLASAPGCEGDAPPSVDTLVRIADGLQPNH